MKGDYFRYLAEVATSDARTGKFFSKAKLYQEATFFIIIFFLHEVNIQVQNRHGVLRRLVPRLKCMKLACQVLHGHFGPVFLLQVSKNNEQKRCFLK